MRHLLRTITPCALMLSAFMLTMVLGVQPARSEDPKPQTGESAKTRRLVVSVRNGSAKDLAAVLQKHFQGEAEIQAAPDAAKNSLLIAATPAVFDDVVATVSLLDHASRQVIVDVSTFDIVSTDDSASPAKSAEAPLTDRDFSGPIDQVLARLDSLARQKRISNLKQMRVESVEGQSGQFQSGEERPRINGFTPSGAPGIVTPQFQQRPVGTIVQVTPRIIDPRHVLLDLMFRIDRIGAPDEPISLGNGPDGPILATEVVTANLTARLTVPVGQAIIASRMQADGKSKRTQNRVIIAARIGEENGEKK